MLRRLSPAFSTALAVAAIFAFLFAVFGGLAYGFTVSSSAWLSGFGATLGAIAAPHVAPKAFRHPALWQVCFSVIGCLLFAVYLQASPAGYALAVVTGIILGYSAPCWIKHFQTL